MQKRDIPSGKMTVSSSSTSHSRPASCPAVGVWVPLVPAPEEAGVAVPEASADLSFFFCPLPFWMGTAAIAAGRTAWMRVVSDLSRGSPIACQL